MAGYTSPGVVVTNQYEPLVSPVLGGDRLMAIIGEVTTSNINLSPTVVVEGRKLTTVPDTISFFIAEDTIASINDTDRVKRLWQGGTQFTLATTDYISTETKSTTGNDVRDFADLSTVTTATTAYEVIGVYSKDTQGGTFTSYISSGTAGYTAVLSDNAGTLRVTLTWAGVEPTVDNPLTIVVADPTIDAHVAVDNYTYASKAQIDLKVYWGTAAGVTNGSSYLVEVYKEYPSKRAVYTNFDEVVKAFGPIVDPTSTDVNTAANVNKLVMASYLAFKEGAPVVMLAPYAASGFTSTNALEGLLADDRPNIVVALDSTALSAGGASLNDLLLAHVLDASSEQYQKFRMGIFNPTVAAFNTAYTSYTTIAGVCNSLRAVVVGPSQLTFKIPTPISNEIQDFKSDGMYGAVVYAAMMTRPEYDVATAMLRKASRTIANIRTTHDWDDRKLDMVAALGITLFAKRNGLFVVRDDITTNQDGLLLKNEPSITMVADYVARATIKMLDAQYIGGKLKLPTTLENIKSGLIKLLMQIAGDELINGAGDPQLSVDPNDPRKINVIIPIVPIFKTREINITFSYVSSL